MFSKPVPVDSIINCIFKEYYIVNRQTVSYTLGIKVLKLHKIDFSLGHGLNSGRKNF
jgi:hypothetical protein